jgi:hypothetical protein
VALSEQPCRSQKLKIKQEEEARQMHSKLGRQAEEERMMQMRMQVQLNRETARRLEVQSKEIARQNQVARHLSGEARRQTQLQEGLLKKQKDAPEVQIKNKQVSCQRLQQEQEASQRSQLKSNREEVSRQMLTQQHEETSHAQERMQRKLREKGLFIQETAGGLLPGWEIVKHRRTGCLYYFNCATGETTLISEACDRARAGQQRQLQSNQVTVSPWEAFCSIMTGGIAAGFRYLLGACNGSQRAFDAYF